MLFSAEITELKMIFNVLRSILIKEFVILRPMEEGLKITLEEMKCSETSTYIPSIMFSSYRLHSNDIVLKVSLKILTEILNIFGDDNNPNLKLSYESFGAPLCIVISHSEETIMVDCEIRTMNIDDYDSTSLAEECNTSKIVIEAKIFTEILQRLDNSSDEIKIDMSPNMPHFTLTAFRCGGESQLGISKHSESITSFQCEEQISAVYKFTNIRQILKVMTYADKVAVFMGKSGLLGFHLVVKSDEKQMFVEYYTTSQYSDEES